jgi:hypothetical protein
MATRDTVRSRVGGVRRPDRAPGTDRAHSGHGAAGTLRENGVLPGRSGAKGTRTPDPLLANYKFTVLGRTSFVGILSLDVATVPARTSVRVR